MIEFVGEYGLFLAKSITVVVAILLVISGILASKSRRTGDSGSLSVRHLNDELEEMKQCIEEIVLDKDALKHALKQEKQQAKQARKEQKKKLKEGSDQRRKRIYVLDFDGDIEASDVAPLREEISAILTLAERQDEVVVRLESSGGMVHSYGLAASQLDRIKRAHIPLTICVDKVAASGGYMMACLADRLLAAPFAVLGSIGVVAEIPNFHRLLKKQDIDYEVLTAGEYKRTLTLFGENTEQSKEKFLQDLEDTHQLFKEHVEHYRPQLDMPQVATGETWFGTRALDAQLVDELITSDEYLTQGCDAADIYLVSYEEKQSLQDKLSALTVSAGDGLLMRWYQRLTKNRFLSL